MLVAILACSKFRVLAVVALNSCPLLRVSALAIANLFRVSMFCWFTPRYGVASALAIGTAAEMTESCAEPAAMLELMRPLEFMNWLALDVACCMSGLSCAMIDRTCPAVVSVVGFRTTFCAVAVVGLTFCAAPMMPGEDCATSIGCADCTVSHGRRADGLLTMGLTVTGVAMLYSLLCSPHCPTGRIMNSCR